MILILDRFIEESGSLLDLAGGEPVHRNHLLRNLLGAGPDEGNILESMTLDEWQEFDERAISEEALRIAAMWIFSGDDHGPVRRGRLLLQDFSPTPEQLRRIGMDVRECLRAAWRSGRAAGFEEGVQTGKDIERRTFGSNIKYLRLCEKLLPYAAIREAQEAIDAKERSVALKIEQLDEREQRLQNREQALEIREHRASHALPLTDKSVTHTEPQTKG